MGHWEKKLCLMIEDDLEAITEKGHVAPNDLEYVHMLVNMWSKLKTQKAMDDYIDDEWYEESGYYDYRMPRRYDGSYRRGRDSMGRYTSRDSEKDSLKQQIHELSRRVEAM